MLCQLSIFHKNNEQLIQFYQNVLDFFADWVYYISVVNLQGICPLGVVVPLYGI